MAIGVTGKSMTGLQLDGSTGTLGSARLHKSL